MSVASRLDILGDRKPGRRGRAYARKRPAELRLQCWTALVKTSLERSSFALRCQAIGLSRVRTREASASPASALKAQNLDMSGLHRSCADANPDLAPF